MNAADAKADHEHRVLTAVQDSLASRRRPICLALEIPPPE